MEEGLSGREPFMLGEWSSHVSLPVRLSLLLNGLFLTLSVPDLAHSDFFFGSSYAAFRLIVEKAPSRVHSQYFNRIGKCV